VGRELSVRLPCQAGDEHDGSITPSADCYGRAAKSVGAAALVQFGLFQHYDSAFGRPIGTIQAGAI
jgi:hypothetical protein